VLKKGWGMKDVLTFLQYYLHAQTPRGGGLVDSASVRACLRIGGLLAAD